MVEWNKIVRHSIVDHHNIQAVDNARLVVITWTLGRNVVTSITFMSQLKWHFATRNNITNRPTLLLRLLIVALYRCVDDDDVAVVAATGTLTRSLFTFEMWDDNPWKMVLHTTIPLLLIHFTTIGLWYLCVRTFSIVPINAACLIFISILSKLISWIESINNTFSLYIFRSVPHRIGLFTIWTCLESIINPFHSKLIISEKGLSLSLLKVKLR